LKGLCGRRGDGWYEKRMRACLPAFTRVNLAEHSEGQGQPRVARGRVDRGPDWFAKGALSRYWSGGNPYDLRAVCETLEHIFTNTHRAFAQGCGQLVVFIWTVMRGCCGNLLLTVYGVHSSIPSGTK